MSRKPNCTPSYPEELLWWKSILTKIVQHNDLTFEEAMDAANNLFNYLKREKRDLILLLSAFFGALTLKGLTVEELTGMAKAMEATKTFDFNFEVDKPIVTGGGTGGDTIPTINVTTPAILIAASAGATAIKSGSRAFSSKTGATDLALTMGINIHASPRIVKKCVERVGTTVWSSTLIYPWMESLLKVRNNPMAPVLFPLLNSLRLMIATSLNPFSVKRQLRGISSPDTALIAKVLSRIGYSRALVPLGYGPSEEIRIDEFSNLGKSLVSELKSNGKIDTYEVFPEELGIKRGRPQDVLATNNHEQNTKIVLRVLSGRAKGSTRDLILINAGAVLYLADCAKDLKEGYEIASNAVDTGKALQKIRSLIVESGGDIKRFNALTSSL